MPTSSLEKLDILASTKYQEFKDLFHKVKASRLPNHQTYHFPINLPGKDLLWGQIYNLAPIEL